MVAADLPPTMRSLVSLRKCKPAEYDVIDMPTPHIEKPYQVLLKMKAAAINTGDTQVATGRMNWLFKVEFPLKVGIEGSGVVVAVGEDVTTLKPGDEVYGFNLDKPVSNSPPSGFASQYAISEPRFLLKKPSNVSWEEAAALPGLTTMALQGFRRAIELRGGDLKGLTLYVPAALGAGGSIVIQVAKNVYGVGKVIATVSTAKMGLVEEKLGKGMVDELIDYQKTTLTQVVDRESVDVMYNTQWGTIPAGVPLIKPSGVIVSMTGIPRGAVAKEFAGDKTPAWAVWLCDVASLAYKFWMVGRKRKFEMVSGSPNVREDLEQAHEWVEKGLVRPVMTVVDLEDVEGVRGAVGMVETGKGGLGKLVVRIDK